MKTDILFYSLLEIEPALLLHLADIPVPPGVQYRFQAIELKASAKRTDAVLLPDSADAPVIVAEVQYQRDETIYHRLVSETARLLLQMPEVRHVQMVVLFPSHETDTGAGAWQPLCTAGLLRVMYLNELLDAAAQAATTPNEQAALQLMKLTVTPYNEAADRASIPVILRTIAATKNHGVQKILLNLLSNAYLSKYKHITTEEIEAMINMNEIFDDLHENVSFKKYGEEQRLAGKLESIPKLLALGLTTRQIADALNLPLSTVESVQNEALSS